MYIHNYPFIPLIHDYSQIWLRPWGCLKSTNVRLKWQSHFTRISIKLHEQMSSVCSETQSWTLYILHRRHEWFHYTLSLENLTYKRSSYYRSFGERLSWQHEQTWTWVNYYFISSSSSLWGTDREVRQTACATTSTLHRLFVDGNKSRPLPCWLASGDQKPSVPRTLEK